MLGCRRLYLLFLTYMQKTAGMSALVIDRWFLYAWGGQVLEHLVIEALFSHEFLVRAHLDDSSVLQDYNTVSISHG